MPRAGFSTEEQSTSSMFRFEEGRGRVVNAVVTVDQVEGYDAKCGVRLTIQRMGRDGKPTTDDPIDEFLACGPVSKFHPGNAKSSNDPDPEDLGDDVGTEGNCIFSIEGAHVDKKSKTGILGTSLQEAGIRPILLNGFLPNIIDLEADFMQLVLPKGDNFTGKRDPTCLVVKTGGKIHNVAEINKRAGGGPAGAGAGAAAPAAKPAVAGAGAVARPTAVVAGRKPVAAPPPPPPPPPVEEVVAVDGEGEIDPVIIKTVELMQAVEKKGEAQQMTKAKLKSRIVTLIAAKRVAPAMHKPIQALIADADWFAEQAGNMGWVVDGDEVTIAAAPEPEG